MPGFLDMRLQSDSVSTGLCVMSVARAGELWSGGSGRSDLSVSDMRLRHSHLQEQPSMHTSSDA